MELVTSQRELEALLPRGGWKRDGGCVLVPTMGALHAGHGALIERGARLAAERGLRPGVVVWIFVNPTQFDEKADFERYPRTLEADAALCRAAGAAVVYAPAVEDVYPPGETVPTPALPPVATQPGLEDARRPGHFAGVCQVVARMFEMTRPAMAVFGEKDWQQLQVVTAMTKRQGMDLRIWPVRTVREPDGLAMSSRNRFLKPHEREAALGLSRALAAAARVQTVGEAEAVMRKRLEEAGAACEYAVVRDSRTLMPVGEGTYRSERGTLRALVAARVGNVRLIDNCDWTGGIGRVGGVAPEGEGG